MTFVRMLIDTRIGIVLSALILSLGIAGGAPQVQAGESAAPLPNNIRIIPPDSSLKSELSAFSGKWRGDIHYYGRIGTSIDRDIILVVERVDMNGADIIHSFGPTRLDKAGYARYKATFSENTLSFSAPAEYRYVLKDQDTIEVTRIPTDAHYKVGHGILKRY